MLEFVGSANSVKSLGRERLDCDPRGGIWKQTLGSRMRIGWGGSRYCHRPKDAESRISYQLFRPYSASHFFRSIGGEDESISADSGIPSANRESSRKTMKSPARIQSA